MKKIFSTFIVLSSLFFISPAFAFTYGLGNSSQTTVFCVLSQFGNNSYSNVVPYMDFNDSERYSKIYSNDWTIKFFKIKNTENSTCSLSDAIDPNQVAVLSYTINPDNTATIHQQTTGNIAGFSYTTSSDTNVKAKYVDTTR
ncbi:MAG: hypothetical protein GY821_13765 [Gammaproteobacteria bacterium]|nr:hypothetical protein [Gammaproteobacteria bacterium]